MAKHLSPVLLLCSAIALSGCADFQARYRYRYGPDPIIQTKDVAVAARRQRDIMNSLALNALGYVPPPAYDDNWYDVVQFGFNYIDEKCDLYLRNLFVLDRQRNRIKGGLLSISSATTAILGFGKTSPDSIQIVAQAFGLGGQLTEVVVNSYLLSRPELVYKNVDDARLAYRRATDAFPQDVHSIGVAYSHMRGYLALCLPPSIEARSTEALARTGAGVKSESPGADVAKPQNAAKTTSDGAAAAGASSPTRPQVVPTPD